MRLPTDYFSRPPSTSTYEQGPNQLPSSTGKEVEMQVPEQNNDNGVESTKMSVASDESELEQSSSETEADRLLLEAEKALRGEISSPTPSRASTANASPSNTPAGDFLGELKEKISHMRNRDEVHSFLILFYI